MSKQSFNVKQNKRIYLGVWESVIVILHSEWPNPSQICIETDGIIHQYKMGKGMGCFENKSLL